MPMRPGLTGTKSCFSLLSVLKSLRGKSAVEDRLQIGLDVVFVDALGQRQLLDEQITRCVKHLALAEAQVLVELEQVQVPEDLGDLEDGPGLDLLHVFAVPAVPRWTSLRSDLPPMSMVLHTPDTYLRP